MGEAAQPGLRKALAGKPPEEVRRRLRPRLEELEAAPPSAERRRGLRAVNLLGHFSIPAARQALRELDREELPAWLTREARAPLRRAERGADKR